MPFLFNFKALLGVLVTLAVLFSIIFFFAFFAILALPSFIIYLFRKNIQLFYYEKFSNQFYDANKQRSYKDAITMIRIILKLIMKKMIMRISQFNC